MKKFLKSKYGRVLCGCAAAILIAAIGWFVSAYRIIDGGIYAKDSLCLDLQEKNVTPKHYDAVREAFPDAEILWNVPFQDGFVANTCPELEIAALTDEDVVMLDYLPYLKTVDARGCTDYPQLEALIARRPEVEVLYTVEIDGVTYDQDASVLHLIGFTEEELALTRYLPHLRAVYANHCQAYDLLLELQRQRPECLVSYSVRIDGTAYSNETDRLDLCNVSLEELQNKLKYLPKLEQVYLLDPEYDTVTVAQLIETYPDIRFQYEMDILGIRVTEETTELDLSGLTIGSLEELERALLNFPDLERVFLGWCKLDNEELAAMRDRNRSRYKLVWTIIIGALWVDTDDTWFMPGKYDRGVTEEQAQLLKYCEDMVCIDVGHKPLETCEFVRYMPNLKYLILADTNIGDLTPLSTCKNLVFLELFLCFATDYTPLLGCTALEDLNIGYTWGDPEPIKQMTWLKRLWWACQPDLTAELTAALPNTELMLQMTDSSTANGWRQSQHYYDMRDMLGMYYMW